MFKSSPPVRISAWDKAAVAAVETPADSVFRSLSTTYVRMVKGKAVVTTADIPDFQHYDRGRVTFGDVSVTGAPTKVVLELLGLDTSGVQRSLGTSTYAGGAFPAIEFDVTYEKYFVRVSELTGGTTPAVTAKPFVQGFYRAASTG